jgi:squalene-hopene/tetraprenyl-beta-curcumene cyclase
MTRLVAVCCSALFLAPLAVASGQSGNRGGGLAAGGLSAETRQRLIEASNKGAEYLRQQQKPDGTFDANPGVTALAATALLRQPGSSREKAMQTVGKTLDYLRALAKPDGGIYEKTIPHYITAVSSVALVAGGRPADRPIIERARQYIAENMLDESEGVPPSDKWYGGMGYGSAPRPDRRADIISLQYALQALRETELPDNHAAWNKALTFLQRTQNNSETNDQSFAANDGGFMYYPGFTYHAEGGTRSYGSATYAGVLSYSFANVRKTDQRVQAVLRWVRDNYTVDENPGMGQKTVYYYYLVFAKALQAVGDPIIVDATGQRHNWREDLGRKLVSLQNAEGYWVNTEPMEMQTNRTLVTTFVMSAIEAIVQ